MSQQNQNPNPDRNQQDQSNPRPGHGGQQQGRPGQVWRQKGQGQLRNPTTSQRWQQREMMLAEPPDQLTASPNS